MKKVLLKAPLLSQSGYGIHSRLILKSLLSQPEIFDVYLINIHWGLTSWITEDTNERRTIDRLLQKTIEYTQSGGHFDLFLHVTIPNEWETLGAKNIGITAGIEVAKVPSKWIDDVKRMDKVIAVSEFTKQAFVNADKSIENKIDVVGFDVQDVLEPETLDLNLRDNFNFLMIGTFIPRKNIHNSIKWFVEEFHDQKVGLVIKTSYGKHSLVDRNYCEKMLKRVLQEYPERKCNVYLLHGEMTSTEMSSLYQHKKIKCLVNLGHGEGFGLPIFEAAYHGIPIISTNFGGQNDFINLTSKKGEKNLYTKVAYDVKPVQREAYWEDVVTKESMWAFPKEWSAKKALRNVKKNYTGVLSKAKKLQKLVNEKFSSENVSASYINSILGKEYIEPRSFDGVSFCITTNASKVEKTKKCIQMIKNQLTTKAIEIIVSGDVEPFRGLEGIKLVNAKETAHNGLLAELRNVAARAATQDVIVYMDDDMLLSPTWLWRLESFSDKEGWDILGNKLLNPDGSRFWDRAIKNPHVLVSYGHPSDDPNLYQTGGFAVHRREVFENHEWDGTIPINNFENNGGASVNEDIEYYARLYENGYIIKFDEGNTTWHWDDGYTQVFDNVNNISLTLLKEEIEKQHPEVNFPAENNEFSNLVSQLGA